MSDKRPVKPGGVKAHPIPDDVHQRGPDPIREEKHDRNGPCPCGSGKKYKKCCADGKGIWATLKSLFTPGAP